MSPGMNNFFEEMLEAAKAREALPHVQAELEQAQDMIQKQGSVIAAREQSILSLKAEVERLNEAVRQAEVSRDDAELRFLELDEKAGATIRALDSIIFAASATRDSLAPPAPTPVPTPVAVQSEEQVSGVSVSTDPINASLDAPSQTADAIPPAGPMPSTEPTYPWLTPTGQSDAAPTAQPSDTPSGATSEAVQPVAVTSTGEGSAVAEPFSMPAIQPDEGVSVSPSPTSAPLDSTTGTTTPTADTSGIDPTPTPLADIDFVTYADEPGPGDDGFMDWDKWYTWAGRMDARYGAGKWPARAA